MNLIKFDSYSSDERLQIIMDQGIYLITRKGRNCRISLYHVGQFFVEVWFDPEDTDIKMVRGFESATFLEPYLDKIKLLDLYASL